MTFDGQGKIQQIRQSWDQGSLLKQLDVIGKTGRNWPISDSKDQIKMIEFCVKTVSNGVAAQAPTDLPVRPHGNSSNVSRDPRSSFSLFGVPEENDQSITSVISPRGGVKPRQRDFTEILGDEPVEDPESPSAGRRSESPSKAVAPKAGATKKFQPSRLFDTEEEEPENAVPDEVRTSNHHYRPNPKKYDHFDFADGSDPHDAPRPGNATFQKTKHSSQWDFQDFVTPAKAKPTKTIRQQDVRHWGADDDDVPDSPERKPAAPKPRKDAETHFDFIDDGPAQNEPRVSRPRGATHNAGLGLYKNNLYDENGDDETTHDDDARPLGVITNLKDRGRDFAPHFAMTDQSPAQEARTRPIADDRKKAVKMMDANWSSYDVSPSQKENHRTQPNNGSKTSEERGIHIGGDGMGGSRGSNRNWMFSDDEGNSPLAKPVAGRKQGKPAPSGGFNWDF